MKTTPPFPPYSLLDSFLKNKSTTADSDIVALGCAMSDCINPAERAKMHAEADEAYSKMGLCISEEMHNAILAIVKIHRKEDAAFKKEMTAYMAKVETDVAYANIVASDTLEA